LKIEYRKLTTQDDFNQCIDLQRNVFGLNDIDIISPLILQLIARENPPLGQLIGAFDVSQNEQELIGFILSMATFQEKSGYIPIMGVKNQYRSKGLGINLFLKLREESLKININYLQGVFEPLHINLANLFFKHLSFTGIFYQKDVYFLSDDSKTEIVPTDKILFKWNLRAYEDLDNHRNISKDILAEYPIATKDNMPNSPIVLVEIPDNFHVLEKQNKEGAMFWRLSTRSIFTHYLNQQNYIVYDCISLEENGIQKSFYLLKDQ
jgi:predicted GNAT superfamily acetyltransferase